VTTSLPATYLNDGGIPSKAPLGRIICTLTCCDAVTASAFCVAAMKKQVMAFI
jgi:hypothetical protein